MKVIQPNCRSQFTPGDIAFILTTLGRPASGTEEHLLHLLSDEESLDVILDDPSLYQALLDRTDCLSVSDHLYFYILVRHVLRESGITSRTVADYVAEVLCEFSRAERGRCLVPGQEIGLDYFFEMLQALQQANDQTAFYIRAHIGNYALFLAGLFVERIRYRAECRGFPDVSYYEELGRSNYRVASGHRLAQRYALEPVFTTLSESFQDARFALNDVAQRVFSLGDNDSSVDLLLSSLSSIGQPGGQN